MRIAIILEGGLIQSVITDHNPDDIQVASVDLDTEGVDDEELTTVAGKSAVITQQEVSFNPPLLDQVFPNKEGYTVVLLYPDYSTSEYGSDIYTGFTPAGTPGQAVEQVQKDASADNDGDIPPADFKAIVVVEGDHSIMGPLEIEGEVRHGE